VTDGSNALQKQSIKGNCREETLSHDIYLGNRAVVGLESDELPAKGKKAFFMTN